MEAKIPIEKGERVEVEIVGIGSKGDGISKYNNFVVIVPSGEIGKRYNVIITDIYDKFCFSQIVEEVE